MQTFSFTCLVSEATVTSTMPASVHQYKLHCSNRRSSLSIEQSKLYLNKT
ncbi:unnamed protein product, partial [Rotaria sp. Silwood2]